MNQDTGSNIKCRGSRKTANYRWPRYLSTSISINGEAGGGTGWSRVWILRDREWEQRPGIDGCGTSRMWGQVWPGSPVRQCHGTMTRLLVSFLQSVPGRLRPMVEKYLHKAGVLDSAIVSSPDKIPLTPYLLNTYNNAPYNKKLI